MTKPKPKSPARLWAEVHDWNFVECHGTRNSHYRWDSWKVFFKEYEHADIALNLVVRWDWHRWDPKAEDYVSEDVPHHDRFEHRLRLAIMNQRLNVLTTHEIPVAHGMDDQVRAFLKPHADYLMGLWAPFQGGP